MAEETDLEQLKDIAHRKHSRNMLYFQRLEQLMKVVLSRCPIAFYASEAETALQRRADWVRGKTLGWLIDEFVESVYAPERESAEPIEELKEIQLQIMFRIGDGAFYESRKAALNHILQDRNHLAHHFLPQVWKWNSLEQGQNVIRYLDEQFDRIRPEVERMELVVAKMVDLLRRCGQHLQAEETQQELERQFLIQTPIVILMAWAALTHGGNDGWLPLHKAIQAIKAIGPQETASLQNRHGYRTLKQLLTATRMFEFSEEPTPKGKRLIFRLTPDARAEMMQETSLPEPSV